MVLALGIAISGNTSFDKDLTSKTNLWDTLLKRHVDSEGNVDYEAFKEDQKELEVYLEQMKTSSPAKSWTKARTIAYYINLYNAVTIKLILDNYPIQSIREIKNPWKQKLIRINGNSLSLGDIEHKILREMNEPRIHFAINCASISCPKLLNEAFCETELEMQLEKATKEFILDSSKNKFEKDSIQLSKIFKWYKKDFDSYGNLEDYLNSYLENPLPKNPKISYLEYNWALNTKISKPVD